MTVLVKRFASNDLSELWNELVSRGRIEAIFNRLLSVFLKRLLNQARPATTSRTDPGMPSSHAQSMSFISVFAVLSDKSKLEPRHPLFPLPTVKTDWSMLLLCSYGMAWNQRSLPVPKHAHPRIGFIFCKCFNYSIRMLLNSFSFLVNQFALISPSANVQIRLRVSQKLHTSNQVVVGGLMGSVFCIFRYKTWNLLLLEAYESSLLLQLYVFLVASAYTLAFAAYVVLNWFRHDR
uniref:Dolichyldiphosphatase n=3 Tax=Brassica TaxID=3705 RepID=M4F6Y9_BRACM